MKTKPQDTAFTTSPSASRASQSSTKNTAQTHSENPAQMPVQNPCLNIETKETQIMHNTVPSTVPSTVPNISSNTDPINPFVAPNTATEFNSLNTAPSSSPIYLTYLSNICRTVSKLRKVNMENRKASRTALPYFSTAKEEDIRYLVTLVISSPKDKNFQQIIRTENDLILYRSMLNLVTEFNLSAYVLYSTDTISEYVKVNDIPLNSNISKVKKIIKKYVAYIWERYLEEKEKAKEHSKHIAPENIPKVYPLLHTPYALSPIYYSELSSLQRAEELRKVMGRLEVAISVDSSLIYVGELGRFETSKKAERVIKSKGGRMVFCCMTPLGSCEWETERWQNAQSTQSTQSQQSPINPSNPQCAPSAPSPQDSVFSNVISGLLKALTDMLEISLD